METTKGNFRKKLLVTSISSCLLASAFVQAQEEEMFEEVVVTGIRGSLETSLDMKRDASSFVDAITAEDIGKFPDKNVAESLARIPGITIDRDFGEGQGVTIRGVSPDQNITLLNGQAVGTSNWFVLSNATRNFNYEILASEMIGGVEVYKSAQADIDEGGLGGTVILRTRKPLDMDANTVHVSAEGQYSSNGENFDPTLSGMYSWKNDNETFGFLVSLSQQERSVHREGMEDFGWFGPSIDRIDPLMEGPALAGGGNDDKGAIPWGNGSVLFEQERERTGIDLTAQFAPSDNLDMTVHYLSSEMKADNVNSNLIGIGFRGVAYLGTDTDMGMTNDQNVIEELYVRGGENHEAASWSRFMAYDNIYRDGSEMSTEVIDFEGNFFNGPHTIHWQLGQTTGEGTNRDFFTEFWADPTDERTGLDFYNPGGTAPYIDFTTYNQWMTNPGDEMWLGGIFDQVNMAEDQENYAQVDYDLEVDLGAVNTLSFGAKVRDRSFSQQRFQTNLSNLAPTGEGSLGAASDFWNGDLITVDHSATTNRGSQTYFMPDRELMYNALYAVDVCGVDDTSLCRNDSLIQNLASFDVEEDITALYAMATFEANGVRGNVGMRYVETEQQANGYNADGSAQDAYESDYSAWLPSLNVAYDLSEELVLRFAAGRALTRPAPFQLAPSFNLTPETGRGSSGNPDLKPLLADQYEMGIEWYFADASNASATAFKKDITNFIFNQVVSAEIEGVQYNQLQRPENGGASTIEGVEVQFTHSFDSGFGVLANYTYTDVSSAEVQSAVSIVDDEGTITGSTLETTYVQFPNASKNAYNLGAFFENDTLSARLNYSYRSEYFIAQTEIGNQMRDEQVQLDAQLSYYVTDNLTLKLEALNLTDEVVENYYVRATDGVRLGGTTLSNGQRVFIGASYKF
ncbi:TonB-dependent receptor [Gilvimarinus sp. 1_MG-2023]|uniref:TonB-dependent receptor n=1 Tax=Gilvimarinus sp. 1_MG-2023 TaxID=3062638 RepID=UPI0026E20F89|nr:TonB-dependent receptor [Gilvimarinus sp. 1_MG-2023]MDO6746773.1 TonB-dependent receptor [Gilvimarinus sp. 1_MG-2023]